MHAAVPRLKRLFRIPAACRAARFVSSDGVQPLALGSFSVDAAGGLLGELRELLGANAARLG